MELKGLRVNIGKTKVMRCKVRIGQAEESGKYPCGVCRQGVDLGQTSNPSLAWKKGRFQNK